MNIINELREWLDANTEIETDFGNAVSFVDRESGKTRIAYDDAPWISVYRKSDGEALYTDTMSYCDHGFGDHSKDEEWFLGQLPKAVAKACESYYDGVGEIERAMQEYIVAKFGWTFNLDYFDSPDPISEAKIAEDLKIPFDDEREEF